MRYQLRKEVIATVPIIEISETDYRAYKTARRVLLDAFAIEQKYELLILNYLEFEKQIVRATTDYMVRDYIGYADFFTVNLGLNVRLVNLLTSARLYVDQIYQHVRQCLGSAYTKEAVKTLLSTEHDEHPEYRFMS